MKKALVLCGGGAKGAYHVGCIKALRELNITFDIVCGTSIGAMNGLLMVQQDYEALENLWKNMTINTVMNTPPNFTDETIINKSNLLLNFFKKYVSEKGADITPLKNTVNQLFDINKYQNSPMQYGLVCVKYPSLEPLELSKGDFEDAKAVNYALASGACFPIFPVYYIDEQGYIDGGYYDNLPISLAFRMGADEVVAVELHTKMTHEHYDQRPNIKTIIPSHELGNFLDFDRKTLDQRIMLGYLDTMKAYNKLYGYRYAFKKNAQIDGTFFYHSILRIEDVISRMKSTKLLKQNCPLTACLMKYCTNKTPSINDYLILAFENVLEYYEYPYDIIYDYQDTAQALYKQFIELYQEDNDHTLFSNKSMNYLHDKIKQFTSKERIYYFFQQISMKESEITMSVQLFEQEFIIALFMYCFAQTNKSVA